VIISYDDFARVDVRVGTVLHAAPNPGAHKPAYILEIDFGPGLGRKKASARVTELYAPEQLVGRQVAAVVNFPPRQIAQMISEVLVLGFPDAEGRVALIGVDRPVPDGARMF
jgi:tRNA-binding protein